MRRRGKMNALEKDLDDVLYTLYKKGNHDIIAAILEVHGGE